MKVILLILICAQLTLLNAQVLPTHNELTELGISFDIPEGWTGELREDIIVMGHNSITGLIVMTTNEAKSTQELKATAMETVVDEGVHLQAIGEFIISGNDRVSGEYQGTWEGEKVKCYAIGLVNHLGSGVNILAVTTEQMYGEQHKKEANKIAASVRFFKPQILDQTLTWRNKLVPSLVKYLKSSYSSDYSGGSSGYSSTESITLCSDGYFSYYSNDMATFSAGDGLGSEVGGGYANSNGSAQGQHEIKTIGAKTYLILNFENGEVYEYRLDRNQEGHTLLNGTRYYVVDNETCN